MQSKAVTRFNSGSTFESSNSKRIDSPGGRSSIDMPNDNPNCGSRPAKNRRPDIPIYVPKYRLYASRVSEMSHSSKDLSKKKGISGVLVKGTSSCCSGYDSSDIKPVRTEADGLEDAEKQSTKVLDSAPLKSKSWADQVEEQLSGFSGSSSEGEDVAFSFDGGMLKEKRNSVTNVSQQEISSTEYAGSSGKSVSVVKQEVREEDVKTDSSCSFQKQGLQHPFTGHFIQPGSELYDKIKAREEIVDRQLAFFEKMAARSSSGKTGISKKMAVTEPPTEPMSSASAAALPSHVPCAPVSNNSEKLSWPADREQIADRQLSIIDGGNVSVRPIARRVSTPALPSHLPRATVSNSRDVLKWPADREQIADRQLSIIDGGNVFQSLARPDVRRVPAPILPAYVPCPKLDHMFCVRSDCLNTYYSYFLDACHYIPPPRPLVKNV